MTNIAEVKVTLSRTAEEASTVAATLRAAAEEAGRSVHLLRASFGSTGHPRALQGLANVEQYRSRLLEAAEMADRGAEAVRAYMAVLG